MFIAHLGSWLFAQDHPDFAKRGRRRATWKRLHLEWLEDRTLPSAFYNLTTIASTAGGVFNDFGNLPSLNNQGEVAFVADTDSGNGIWMSGALPGQTLTNVTPTFDATDTGRTFGRGVAINDTNTIVARDQLGTQFFIREWNGNTPDQHTDLFVAPEPVPGSPGDQFVSAQNFTAVNQNGAVAFVLYDEASAVREVVTEPANAIGDGTYSPVGIFNAQGAQVSPRPELTSTGQVLEVSPGDQLILAQSATSQQVIAGSSNGFTEIDPGADVSKDGRVVVFTGNRGKGPGLFAAYQSDSGWQIIRLAGEGLDGFTSFDTTGDVVVNNTWNTERGDTIVFQGTNQSLGTGIYAIRLSFIGDDPAAPNPVVATSVYASGAMPIALVGDPLAGSTVSAVELGQGVNDVGRGQVAFWAATKDGNQDIVLANPTQVVYVNFSPPDKVVGQSATNAALFQQVGITQFGWDASFAGALTDEGVTYDANTMQTQIVNLVQTMYSNAGALVTVLGLPGQAPPAFVPEPVTDANGNVVTDAAGNPITHGTFQTVYVGGDPLIDVRLKTGQTLNGLASPPPQGAGGLDFYYQVPDSTAVVFVNDILHDSSFGAVPSAIPENQVVNGIATIIAHETGHNFGLFHLATADNSGNLDTTDVMINGTNDGEFVNAPQFSANSVKVYPYTEDIESDTESSAKRLDFSTGAPSGNPPDPLLIEASDQASTRANIGFPAANTLNVQHLYVGVVSPFADTQPVFQDLGAGDLATLLNNVNLPVNAADQIMVLGSTDGTSLDIVGVAEGDEGAQDSLSMTLLGLTTDSRLQAPVTGTGAAMHFYQLTAKGDVDLGLAPIETTQVNHAPTLAPISNAVTKPGALVSFTASGSDPDQGQKLTYSLDPTAPIGASIDPATGAFAWTPTSVQAGQVYNFNVIVTDNGTPPLSAAQPVTINVENPLQATSVVEITAPNPGPLQVAIDFNEVLNPTPAQDVANYKIVSDGGISLPLQSAVYTDNGGVAQVALTVAADTTVIPDVYNVSIDAANLTAPTGDAAGPNADQLWVDVTSTNTLEPITVQPDGSFGVSKPSEFLGYAAPQYVVAGDFTGDGHTDLVVATNGEVEQSVKGNDEAFYDPLLLLKNNGNGTYASPVPIALGGGFDIEGLATVDWNHDGSPDLIVAAADLDGTPQTFQYFVLLNDGKGDFSNAPETPIPVSTNTSLSPFAVYDLTGDGQFDIIHPGGTNPTTGDAQLEVIGKDPYLGYSPQLELDIGLGNSPGILAFGDFNGDGTPDIVVGHAGYYGGGIAVSTLLSSPSGYAMGTDSLDTPNPPIALGIGAFTGAGQEDLAVIYDNFSNSEGISDGDVIQVLKNDGGTFIPQNPFVLKRRDVAAAVFGDVNSDGLPDLVLVLTPNGPPDFPTVSQLSVWTFTSDGHGNFIPTTPSPVPLDTTDGSAPTSIALADIDGDGYPDLVLGSSTAGEVRLAINDGTGTMQSPAAPLPFTGVENGYFDQNYVQTVGVATQAFADLNNDGQTDFVTVSPNGVDVYLGEADGSFIHTQSLVTPASVSWVKLGDLNNDGIPDLVCGPLYNTIVAPSQYAIAVYLGNGDGTFRPAPNALVTAGQYGIANLTLADVNGDGDLDAVATLVSSSEIGGETSFPVAGFGVLFGNGKGNLAFNANTFVPAQFSSDTKQLTPILADFNNDGKFDLLVPSVNSSTGESSLTDYLGVGNGTFTPDPIVNSGVEQSDREILVGDLNGDGNLDIITLTANSSGTPLANVYLGNGQGGFTAGTAVDLSIGDDELDAPISPSDLALGDFTGDGKLDLAVSYYDFFATPNMVQIFPGNGNGTFGAPETVTVGANPFTLVSIPRASFLDVGTFAVTDHVAVYCVPTVPRA